MDEDIIENFEPSKYKGKLNRKEMKKLNVTYARILRNATRHCDGAGDYCLRVPQTHTKKRHKNPARARYGHSQALWNAGIAFAIEYKKVPSKYDFKLKNQMMVHICADPIKMGKDDRSKCANGAHIILKSRKYNDSQRPCHSYIRDWERRYRYNTAISVVGKVTVAFINKIGNHEATRECPHKKYPCFIIYDPQ